MASLTLFYTPGACSRVVLNALEEIGVRFSEVVVNLATGEHRSLDMLSVNPRGKVPALKVDQELLTENASILLYLHAAYPDTGLLPTTSDPLARAGQRSDLIWISTTLHPLVRMMFMPGRVSGEDPEGVRSSATAQFTPIAAEIEARLGASTWWYGETWSIVDVYLNWALGMAQLGQFDVSTHPAIIAHGEQVRSRDSFQRALAKEQAAVDSGRATLPPGASL